MAAKPSPGLWLLRLGLASLGLAASHGFALDLRGHGGPVRAIVVGADGAIATASFDTTIIRWEQGRGNAKEVLRFHDGAVNALIALPDGGLASAGEDRRIALWGRDGATPIRVFEGHEAPVSSLAIAPDGRFLASASWDGTVRIWPLDGGAARVIAEHKGPVNAVLFADGGTLISAGYDGTLRIHGARSAVLDVGLPINTLALAGSEVIAAGADGQLRFVDWRKAELSATLEIADVPLVALAASPDGAMIAVAGFRGALVVVDVQKRRVLRKLNGPAFPLWSLAFSSDGRDILTGGADRLVRRWHVRTGEPVNPLVSTLEDAPLKRLAAHPGAEVFKACAACHTLGEQDGNRAGPTLHRIMGRKIGSAPGYAYSAALQGSGVVPMDIIWSRETISRLFDIGPNTMLPGTKMPEQTIPNGAERDALIDFIEKASQ